MHATDSPKVRLSHSSMQSLKWFISVPSFFAQHPIWTQSPPPANQPVAAGQPPVLYTDASKSGWGAVFQQADCCKTLAGRWRRDQTVLPIHVLELQAVLSSITTLWSSTGPPSCRLVHLFTDSTAVFFMLRRWTTRDLKCLPLLQAVSEQLFRLQLQLTVSWVPSDCNPADRPSRL